MLEGFERVKKENAVKIIDSGAGEEEIISALEKGGVAAEDFSAFQKIDAAVQKNRPHSGRIPAGAVLVPDGFSSKIGIRADELSLLKSQMKSLRHVAVRGCVITGETRGLSGKDLGRFFTQGYQAAKKLSVILPTTVPYIFFSGVLGDMEKMKAEDPAQFEKCLIAANITGKQNETAFYAKMLIS